MSRKSITLLAAAALSLAASAVSASPFPWTVNEAGFDNPAAMAYAEQHPVKVARTSGSSFPWTVNEAGPYVAESAEVINSKAVRTAGK